MMSSAVEADWTDHMRQHASETETKSGLVGWKATPETGAPWALMVPVSL
jgi:hypothetical protein